MSHNIKAWIGGLALAGISLSAPAMADYGNSGAGLLRDCKIFINPPENKTKMDYAYSWRCVGNIESVIVTLKTLSDVGITKPLLCPRNVENMSNEVVARIIVKYLEGNPKELSIDRTSLVIGALLDAMPCD